MNHPSHSDLIILLDSKTGVLKSVLLDKGYLSNIRTAIAGAIASKYLSNPDTETVGVIGAGIQAKLQLQALMLVRKPKQAYVWGRDFNKVNQFIEDMKNTIKIKSCLTAEELVMCSNLIITITPK